MWQRHGMTSRRHVKLRPRWRIGPLEGWLKTASRDSRHYPPVDLGIGDSQSSTGHCQSNWIGPARPTIESSQAASWRRSTKAAARAC